MNPNSPASGSGPSGDPVPLTPRPFTPPPAMPVAPPPPPPPVPAMQTAKVPVSPGEEGEEGVDEAPRRPDGPFMAYWRKVGGGSLTISLIVHALFLIAALLIIWTTSNAGPPEQIDFLSGGGGGTEGNTKINQKKRQMMVNRAPAMKIAAKASGAIALPDTTSTLADMSTLSVTSGMMSGTPGSGGGFGGGKGTGRGTGTGAGFGPGNQPGFTASFLGLTSTGNNIIFCIDTSGSMRTNLSAPGITALRRELKKVIDGLPPSAQFNIICFGQNGDLFKPKSVTATQAMKNEAALFMEGYYGGGSADFGRTRTEKYGRAGKDNLGIEYTAILTEDISELAGTEGGSRIDLAMVAAFERKPSTLFVLSDGAPGTRFAGKDAMDKDDIIKLIYDKFEKMMGKTSKLQVNTISIYSNSEEGRDGEKFLRKLSGKFGGKHKEIKPDKL